MATTAESLVRLALRDQGDSDDFSCGTCRLARQPLVISEAQRRGALAARARMMAAVQAHAAHRSRYERELNIPPLSACRHERGARWQQHQMCRDQWAALQQIRAKDRQRRARKREHDLAVERELQTMLAQHVVVASQR
jgi:hypothetical protein